MGLDCSIKQRTIIRAVTRAWNVNDSTRVNFRHGDGCIICNLRVCDRACCKLAIANAVGCYTERIAIECESGSRCSLGICVAIGQISRDTV